jgi:hypothetical protein
MAKHKYLTGELVDMRGRAGNGAAGGPYSIVRQLPEEGRQNLYRLKSDQDGRERVAAECDLSLCAGAHLSR